ncbi:MAG: YggT family protein [Acidimicrobiia bacterium]
MSIPRIIVFALDLYFYAVFLWVILSWIPASSAHAVGRLQTFLDRIVYPAILPIRRVIPPVRIGGGALDLSPIILLVAIRIVRGLF